MVSILGGDTMLDSEKKKTFGKNVLFTALAFATYKLIGVLFISHINNGVVNVFASEVTLLTCAICLALITRKIDVLKFSKNGLGTGLFVATYIFLLDLAAIVGWLSQYLLGKQAITISLGEKILFIIAMIMVGVAEELMFRGVLLNSCIDFFGENSVSALRKAIVISSSIFGVFHIFNVLIGASLYGSVIQAINAAILGMLFGAIYIRSGKNIWPCIIAHAIHDFCSFIQSGILAGSGIKDSVSGYNASALPTVLLSLVICLFLMRKKKMSLCVKE